VSEDLSTARALGEVTTALEHFGQSVGSLERKIETVAEEGRKNSGRTVEKISEPALDVRGVTERLAAHERSDAANFGRLEECIEDNTHDRGRLWRAVAGMSGAGGLGAFLAKFLDGAS